MEHSKIIKIDIKNEVLQDSKSPPPISNTPPENNLYLFSQLLEKLMDLLNCKHKLLQN